jgi:hypothetical protein
MMWVEPVLSRFAKTFWENLFEANQNPRRARTFWENLSEVC